MEEIANSTFIYLTEISYDYGLITRKVFAQRITKLYELNGFEIDDFFPFSTTELEQNPETELTENRNDFRDINLSELGLSGATKINEQLYSKDNVLHFVSAQNGKYCKWKFNEYDADDKPSIPHGHGIEKVKLKLDPYRGLIFNIDKGFDKYEAKEDDKLIKFLWNDNNFRNVGPWSLNFT
ncbi:MAG: hypothetical protein QM751_05845 [Paludibacteraceae bacterium]